MDFFASLRLCVMSSPVFCFGPWNNRTTGRVQVYGSDKMATSSLAIQAVPDPMIRPAPFQELYQQYSNVVYLTALRVTGNSADAEDALQTVFLRILRQEERFEVAWSSAAYFRRAATNASIDILRRRAWQAETPLDGILPQLAEESPALLKAAPAAGPQPARTGRRRTLRPQVRGRPFRRRTGRACSASRGPPWVAGCFGSARLCRK